jgi:hypothetical protein
MDFDDILGDERADIKFKINVDSSNDAGYTYLGCRSNDMEGASKGFHMALIGDVSDGTRLGDYYDSFLPTSIWGGMHVEEDFPDMEINGKSGLYRVFVSVWDANSTSATAAQRADFRLTYTTGLNTAYSDIAKMPQTLATMYLWLDLGVVDLSHHLLRDEYSDYSGSDTCKYAVACKRDSGSYATRIDGIYFMPVEDDAFFVLDGNQITGPNDLLFINSINVANDTSYYYDDSETMLYYTDYLGKIPRPHGGKFTRIYFLMCQYISSGINIGSTLGSSFQVKTYYRPRTSSLFGTIDA